MKYIGQKFPDMNVGDHVVVIGFESYKQPCELYKVTTVTKIRARYQNDAVAHVKICTDAGEFHEGDVVPLEEFEHFKEALRKRNKTDVTTGTLWMMTYASAADCLATLNGERHDVQLQLWRKQ